MAGLPYSSKRQTVTRGLLRGVVDYARGHGRWSVYLGEQRRGDEPPPLARAVGRRRGHRPHRNAVASPRAVARCGRPAVDVSAARLLPDLPWVETDDRAIAAAGRRPPLGRGLRHFALLRRRPASTGPTGGATTSAAASAERLRLRRLRPPPGATTSGTASARWERDEEDLARGCAGCPSRSA